MELLDVTIIILLFGMIFGFLFDLYNYMLINYLEKRIKKVKKEKKEKEVQTVAKVVRPSPSPKTIVPQQPIDYDKELISACYIGNLPKVKILLEKFHANPETTKDSEYNWTPVMVAARKGHLDIVKYLCEVHHVNVEARDQDGWTLLHLACNRGNEDMIKYLVEKQQVNIDAEDKNRYTPLHQLAAHNFLELIKYMCEDAGADPLIVNNHGLTAADVAENNGYHDCAEYLRESEEIAKQ